MLTGAAIICNNQWMRRWAPPWCHHLRHLHLHTRQKFIAPRPATPVPHSEQVEHFPGLIVVYGSNLCWLQPLTALMRGLSLYLSTEHHWFLSSQTIKCSDCKIGNIYSVNNSLRNNPDIPSLLVCGLNQRKYSRGLTSPTPGPATHHEGGNKCNHQPLYCYWYTSR